MSRVLFVVLLGTLLSGCVSSDEDGLFSSLLSDLDSSGKPLPSVGDGTSRSLSESTGPGFAGATAPGTGQFVSQSGPPITTEQGPSGQPEYRLNLVEAPVASAAKNILGDILELNYSVDPRVQGTLTLQTSAPVSRDALIGIFETALAANGFGIVKSSGTYQIVPLSEALANTPTVSVPSAAPPGPGLKVLVVELQYISAREMRSILRPISREGSILNTDPDRNLIMLAGTDSDLAAMRDAISVFDVDWMRGMSVALHPLKTSKPAAVAKELETIFRTDGPGANIIRFIPNDRLNSVLVITSRPQYLARAQQWIEQLDQLAQTSDEQLFVYAIQNRSAKEMAEVLQAVLARASGDPTQTGDGAAVSPDLEEVVIASEGAAAPLEAAGGIPSVVADVENNSLLISATARQYQRIEKILKQLDVLPTQVLLEAVIAEVKLTDELKFGLRWFFESGNFKISLSDLASGFTGPSFPGLAWGFATSSLEVTLNALSSVTDVNVISSPNLMALNNQTATLQIGDQVPIITRTATGVDNPDAPIVATISLKDTGIILRVTPRVNTSGRVLLDIEQEASNVIKTTTSGIDSPTIQQRKISTRVVVNDGETLTLGGLIQERNTDTAGQVPILGRIPILGNAFKNKTNTLERTELIIFIRPRVLRNIEEARSVTDEFRRRLEFGDETPHEEMERDLRRLE